MEFRKRLSIQMNETMLQLLEGTDGAYPHQLEEKYPRVFNKLIELWNTALIDDYFSELLVNDRAGRQGFPSEIAAEIFHLSEVRDKTRVKPASDQNEDVWGSVELKELRIIEEGGFECSPTGFLKSAESGNRAVLSAFIHSGADIDTRDERGWTPLMISSFNGNQEVARLLVEHGASIHIEDTSGYTPLHWAAFNGYTDVVKLLIIKHANLNAQSKHGWTPLLQAATRGHLTTCGALIAGGADVNLSSFDGWTALHKACANGHTEVVRLLLSARSVKDARYKDGTTPMMLALRAKHQEIVELLKK